jgi:hypothetical protein
MELALVNSWVLYKCTRKASGLELDDSDLKFCVIIVLAMVAQWQNMGCVFDPNPFVTASPNSSLKRRPAKNVRKSFGANLEARFTSHDMYFSKMKDIPLLEGQKCKYRQLRCMNEGWNKAKQRNSVLAILHAYAFLQASLSTTQ